MRPTTRSRRRWLSVIALLSAFGLIAAACGDDDDGGGGTTTAAPDGTEATDGTEAPETSAPDTTEGADGGDEGAAGCGEGAVTDPADLSADREPARCEPGFPEPQPLAERQTVRMSSAFRAEFVAPILLADALGEFEAENLDFEFIELGFSDALTQIASGDIDVAVGGTEAALFNAVNQGIDVRWGMGNFFPPDAGDNSVAQTGLWARADAFSDPENPDLTELAGTTMASAVGLGSSIAYPIALAFEEAGLSLLDLTVEQIPSPDMVTALRNGAVQSAWLLDPYWIEAESDGDIILVASQPPGEPIGGLYFAGSMFDEDREKALAFMRAIIRTINTYLSGDYQSDPEVMEALAEVTGTTVESLEATPSLVFDWEIREGTTDRAQNYFIQFGTVNFDEPIPEDQVVDRSLYLEAVGAN